MLPIGRVIAHREWSPGRKSDPVYDMNWRRDRVARIGPRAQEDSDMTPDQAKQLAALHAQLVTGPDPQRAGWDTWPGGSGDRFTVVDYLRKANQRDEDHTREVAALRAQVAELQAAVHVLQQRPDAALDPAAVQAGVTAALGGGLTITGTAVPQRKA